MAHGFEILLNRKKSIGSSGVYTASSDIKTTWTSKGDKMNFGTFLDLEGMWIDTVHFPLSARAFPFTGPGCYKIKGKVMEEFDHITIEVEKQKRLITLNREDYMEDLELMEVKQTNYIQLNKSEP